MVVKGSARVSLVTAVAVLVGCGADAVPAAPTTVSEATTGTTFTSVGRDELVGVQWRVVRMTLPGGEVFQTPADAKPNLFTLEESGVVKGTDSCNGWSIYPRGADGEVTGGGISEILCPPELGPFYAFPQELLVAVLDAEHFELAGDRLVVRSPHGTVEAVRFTRGN